MTDKEIKSINAINKRIAELNTEIYALFDAQDKRINPFKSFKVKGHIHSNDYVTEKEIKLTLTDIQVLQAIRAAEKQSLEKILNDL